ncbi:MAG: aminopeptidase P family protein [Clostridia bacterium]|nr:aminopeptidase P family protein [Clostridia bacterium]
MKKIEVLREKMKGRGLDAVIILDELNQLYLSDFAFTDGLLLITHEVAYLITDFRYYEMALTRANSAFESVMPQNRKDFITDILKKQSCERVGFEGSFVSYETFNRYVEEYPFVSFAPIGDMLEVMRRIKTPEELRKMQLAQDITDKAFSHVIGMITPEMTELDVAVELEYAMRKNGAGAFAFETIAVSGGASALPHGTPRNVKLKHGFLTMDFGAKFEGYCSDMTRTVVIGKADAEMKKLYNTVLNAQLAAIDFLREGIDCGEADKVARDIIDSVPEFKGAFGHSLGHSIGLFVHETPGLSKRGFGTKLCEGQVTSVEPGIYLMGKYGCRIEDMVAIEKFGVHNFTHSTKELIEIY